MSFLKIMAVRKEMRNAEEKDSEVVVVVFIR